MKHRLSALAVVTAAIMLPPALSHAQAPEEVKAEIAAILAANKPLFDTTFRVKVTCKEINQIFQSQMQKASPMPIQLDHFLMTFKGEESNVKVKFASMDPALAEMIGPQADQMINQSPIGKNLPKLTYSFLAQAMGVLLEEKDFKVTKKTEDKLDIMVTGLEEDFAGQKLECVRVRFDRTNKTVSMLQFEFPAKKLVRVKLAYTPVKVPGVGEMPLQSEAKVKQNAFGQAGGPQGQGVALPETFTVTYSDYKFKPSK